MESGFNVPPIADDIVEARVFLRVLRYHLFQRTLFSTVALTCDATSASGLA